MIRTKQHLAVGSIGQRSGAAVAALKARALAWDVPLRETPEGLSLSVWGSELRMIPEPQGWRIELAAPEPRLIGTLRDSATELFAEIGLNVAWDHVDVGALAPGLSLMRVVSVMPLTPGFLRMRVAAEDAGDIPGDDPARFAHGSLHFRLLLPQPGRAPVWPRVGANGRTIWPEGNDALHRPVYTVAAQAGNWLDFDIFRHAGSPTCDWALAEPVGDQVGILGPGGGWCPAARRLHLFGDETALPAIARMLALAQGEVRATLTCTREDLGVLAADARVSRSDDLLAALRGMAPAGEHDHIWFAASAEQARLARQHLLGLGIPRKNFTAAAYWG